MPRFALSTALALVALMGCKAPPPEPVTALRNYGAALQASDFEAAYALMAEEFRARHSLAEFTKLMNNNPKEVRFTAARVRAQAIRVELYAELEYGVGEKLRLVHEDGGWRVASNPTGFYSKDTPRAALRSFLRAFRAKRWDIMLQYVPTDYRKEMSVDSVREQFAGRNKATVAELMARVEANLDAPIEVHGAEARMPYGGTREVVFRREPGGWKIQDLD